MVIVIVFPLAMILTAYRLGTLHSLVSTRTPIWQSIVYVPWAFAQQFILQLFVYVRLQTAFIHERLAVLLGATLFAVAHLPNPLLVPLTFIGAILMTEYFRRYQNVLALGFAHAVSGLSIAAAPPVPLTHNMRVGLACLLHSS